MESDETRAGDARILLDALPTILARLQSPKEEERDSIVRIFLSTLALFQVTEFKATRLFIQDCVQVLQGL